VKTEKKIDVKEEKKAKPAQSSGKNAEKAKEEAKKRPAYVYLIAVVVVLIIIAVVAVLFLGRITGVSFSSFRSNFDSASRIAFLVYNSSNAASLYACSTLSIETLSRPNLTIDYMVVENKTSCLYSPIVHGHNINITNTTTGACIARSNSEPSITLSYSETNSTIISPDHLYIYANDAYLQQCPIAVELS
jgi:hypothetical protein